MESSDLLRYLVSALGNLGTGYFITGPLPGSSPLPQNLWVDFPTDWGKCPKMNDLQAEKCRVLAVRPAVSCRPVGACWRIQLSTAPTGHRFGGRALLPPMPFALSPLVVVGVVGTVVNPREGCGCGFSKRCGNRGKMGWGVEASFPRLPHRGSFHSPPQQRERSASGSVSASLPIL